mmetsp:Transcript_24301/g.61180  ORF Transcript_24301/g.61180 Transcript_24301/m.61180 type:complete len:383 (-) Transcript_24301:400-1548(-)
MVSRMGRLTDSLKSRCCGKLQTSSAESMCTIDLDRAMGGDSARQLAPGSGDNRYDCKSGKAIDEQDVIFLARSHRPANGSSDATAMSLLQPPRHGFSPESHSLASSASSGDEFGLSDILQTTELNNASRASATPKRAASTLIDSRSDVFDSSKVVATVEEPLTTLALEMLAGVAQKLNLDRHKLRSFVRKVELGMLPRDYHCVLHVLDVLQLVYLQTTAGGPIEDICQDPVVKLSVLVAALAHDFGHPGYSNGFLASSESALVAKYGKTSTLEMMHIDSMRRCCAEPDSNFLDGLDTAVQKRVFKYTEAIILSTDMSRHVEFLNAEAPTCPEELIIFKLKLAMKGADLSHCVRKFGVHCGFVERLKAEFYKQGDEERELRLP